MARRFRNLVGPKIRKTREKLDLTQDQLAAKLQMEGLETFDRVVVAKIESQIRSVYDFEVIVISKVLRLEPGELLDISQSAVKAALPQLVEGEM